MAQRAAGSEEAVYRRIAADLRHAIERGELRPGDRVPGENALMQQYGVAKQTARDALAVLRTAGVIDTRPGSGTYVNSFPEIPRRAGRRVRYDQWGTGSGIQAANLGTRPHVVDRLAIGEDAADERVAGLLGLPVGRRVLVRRRRYLVDSRPVQFAVSRFPLDLVRGTRITDEDTGPGGVYARLAERGIAPARFVEELRAHMPTDDEARLLDLPASRPIVTITRIALADDDRPVEVNDMTFDAAAYRFMYELEA